MKFLIKLSKKPKIFQRTIGLSIDQFNLLVDKASKVWMPQEKSTGRPYKLNSLEQKLAMTLMYYKTYLTQEFLGSIVNLDQSNVFRLLTKMRNLIEEAADPALKDYVAKAKKEYEQLRAEDKISNWTSFVEKHPDLKEVASDATEQQCYRSHNNEIQQQHYSGKKKLHTLKTQITVSTSGKVLDVTKTYPGSVHDKKIIDQEKTVPKFPEKTCHRLDSGYQGVPKENPDHYTIIPIKKSQKNELSCFAKDLNRMHSKRRVIVENIFSRLKKFKVCKHTFRGPIDTYNQIFRNVAALLNFRMIHGIAI